MTGPASGSPFPGDSLTRFWNDAEPLVRPKQSSSDSALAEVVPNNPGKRDYWGLPEERPPLGAVKDGEWSYIRQEEDVHEALFHLREDAKEVHNRAGDPAAQTILQQMRATLDRLTGGPLLPRAIQSLMTADGSDRRIGLGISHEITKSTTGRGTRRIGLLSHDGRDSLDRRAMGCTSHDRVDPAGRCRLRDRARGGLASPVPRPVDAGPPRLRSRRLGRGGAVRPRGPQGASGRSRRAAAPGPIVGPAWPRRRGARDLHPAPRGQVVPGRRLLAPGRGAEASGTG